MTIHVRDLVLTQSHGLPGNIVQPITARPIDRRARVEPAELPEALAGRERVLGALRRGRGFSVGEGVAPAVAWARRRPALAGRRAGHRFLLHLRCACLPRVRRPHGARPGAAPLNTGAPTRTDCPRRLRKLRCVLLSAAAAAHPLLRSPHCLRRLSHLHRVPLPLSPRPVRPDPSVVPSASAPGAVPPGFS
ncbi:hypothetical protein BS78_03G220500 [Paspalum vaginatum]|nr:hypothetical protein BS78_03G220500 [Paspalum vaginatum]